MKVAFLNFVPGPANRVQNFWLKKCVQVFIEIILSEGSQIPKESSQAHLLIALGGKSFAHALGAHDFRHALAALGVTVFYDRFEQVNLWGKDVADHLGQVYGKDSRFVVIFASRHYAAKAWPNHEKAFALGRHLKGDAGRILPVRFDETEIPGLPPTIAHLDLRVLTPPQLAELIRQKVDIESDDA